MSEPIGGSVLGLPVWPAQPESVDPSGTSHLVIALGDHPRTASVAGAWVAEAEALAPSRVVSHPDDVGPALAASRTGVRVLVVGGTYDVLTVLATARAHGLGPTELRSFVVDVDEPLVDLPVYCAHCRATHRLHTAPGEEVDCPGCGRRLEVHPHHSAVRGSFLASDARARDVA
ncbi:dimethylamine monooxygenase subunit DmmA family protein [Nocardioides acrostichi]|uniref:Dimethylamine monooxygenase subunit DmmA-like C-terminal domain-containing protein n=1 Tax=Nocardioides acrostichi TaxID=2784339 RepID=A0A930V1P9_9ACTN|nr:dimethylamine monooxygenase subunit DmmA family protein [Nocardioides acrostichi]MBF4162419.1 hypothetical protein [Nocardioides acrostichi]